MAKSSEINKVFGHLTKEVNVDLCENCGACIASCPVGSLEFSGGQPSLSGRCTACGLCYSQCPQIVSDQKIEEEIFRSSESTDLGHYKNIYCALTSSPVIEKIGQDGGVITSLLCDLLEENLIDGAIILDRDSEWRPEPKVATTSEEIRKSSGSKYTPAPMLRALRDAEDLFGLKKVAFVGTPCQVKAFRKMSLPPNVLSKLVDIVEFTIGLFCNFSFSYEELLDNLVNEKLGIDSNNVKKFDLKKDKLIIRLKNNTSEKISLSKLKNRMYVPCKLCSDFSARLADISAGNLGSPKNTTTIITRTEKGEKIFQKGKKLGSFEVKNIEEQELIKPIKNMSRDKAKRAKKFQKEFQEAKKPLPPRLKEKN